MRKFIVHTRALPGCCKTGDAPIILEVDGEVVRGVEDPSVMWLTEGEYRFRILKPESLYEPKEAPGAKDKTMVPPIYCSHMLFSTAHEARAAAYRLVNHSFEFTQRKSKEEYTQEQVAQRCSEIQEILLP